MNGWKGFLALAPEKVRNVIENGPMPLAEYPSGSLSHKHKDMGIQRYKGASGRGVSGKAKVGWEAVVYYDPALAHPDYVPEDIPQEVLDRHSDEAVHAEWEKL